jgi:hypothetical protein
VDACTYAAAGTVTRRRITAAADYGCEWDAGTCSLAVGSGHLAVLQWARMNGCDWDERTCSAAARFGHLTVLQWARANGCAWDRAICLDLAPFGSETCEWILAQSA